MQDNRTGGDGRDDDKPRHWGEAVWSGKERDRIFGFIWAFTVLCGEDPPGDWPGDPTLEQIASVILLSEGGGNRDVTKGKMAEAISHIEDLWLILDEGREQPWPEAETPLRQQIALSDAELSMMVDDDADEAEDDE